MAIYLTCNKAALADILLVGFNIIILEAKSIANGSIPLAISEI